MNHKEVPHLQGEKTNINGMDIITSLGIFSGVKKKKSNVSSSFPYTFHFLIIPLYSNRSTSVLNTGELYSFTNSELL